METTLTKSKERLALGCMHIKVKVSWNTVTMVRVVSTGGEGLVPAFYEVYTENGYEDEKVGHEDN